MMLSPTVAVIPTVGLFGPLALLAMLFPAIFGGLALWLRRWFVVFSVASLASVLYILRAWYGHSVRDSWWGTSIALWTVLAGLGLGGCIWAWVRYRLAVRAGRAELFQPGTTDCGLLGLLAVAGIGLVIFHWTSPGRIGVMGPGWWAVCGAVMAGLLQTILALAPAVRRLVPVSTESAMLGGLTLGFGFLGLTGMSTYSAAVDETGGPASQHRLLWKFWSPLPGVIASSPVVSSDRIYAAALELDGAKQRGVLFCLDRQTGHELWRFTNGGAMKPVFCTPCVADNRIYVGEGFHEDTACKMYCLDATTGVKRWEFATSSHTEASPCVAASRLFFGAGDDGVYCLDAIRGHLRWHFRGPHVDTRVAVHAGRVYVGSGYGTFEMLCLDAGTGKPLWRRSSPLPVFGSPTVSGQRVLFGTGNGDLDHSAEQPAGAVLCLDVTSGDELWRRPAAGAVHTRPVVVADRVFFTSRDGCCYAADGKTGHVIWKQQLGSPIVTVPRLSENDVYVLASAGRVCCLDPETGQIRWSQDLDRELGVKTRLRSSPTLICTSDGSSRYRYFGLDAVTVLRSDPAVVALHVQ